jgi:hypothetical protein
VCGWAHQVGFSNEEIHPAFLRLGLQYAGARAVDALD